MDTEMDSNTYIQPEHNDYITVEERQHLIFGIHRLLVWVGEPLPETVNIDGKILEVHETVWQCIHDKDVTEEEKNNLEDIAHLLEKKEKEYEYTLQSTNLTHEDADKLYHNIASITRAIIDIRECKNGKVDLKENNEDVTQNTKQLGLSVDDAKRWMNFLKTVGKK